eukprot:jgi/Bigna1/71669/fgenesh1_pg.16_\
MSPARLKIVLMAALVVSHLGVVRSRMAVTTQAQKILQNVQKGTDFLGRNTGNGINIGGHPDDENYRYKMPRLQSSWDGKSKRGHTTITNLALISRCLGRSFEAIVKYLGLTVDIAVLKGHVRQEDMQSRIIDELVPRFVLCKACKIPETTMRLSGKGKRQVVQYACRACGHIEDDAMDSKACRVFLSELQRQDLQQQHQQQKEDGKKKKNNRRERQDRKKDRRQQQQQQQQHEEEEAEEEEKAGEEKEEEEQEEEKESNQKYSSVVRDEGGEDIESQTSHKKQSPCSNTDNDDFTEQRPSLRGKDDDAGASGGGRTDGQRFVVAGKERPVGGREERGGGGGGGGDVRDVEERAALEQGDGIERRIGEGQTEKTLMEEEIKEDDTEAIEEEVRRIMDNINAVPGEGERKRHLRREGQDSASSVDEDDKGGVGQEKDESTDAAADRAESRRLESITGTQEQIEEAQKRIRELYAKLHAKRGTKPAVATSGEEPDFDKYMRIARNIMLDQKVTDAWLERYISGAAERPAAPYPQGAIGLPAEQELSPMVGRSLELQERLQNKVATTDLLPNWEAISWSDGQIDSDIDLTTDDATKRLAHFSGDDEARKDFMQLLRHGQEVEDDDREGRGERNMMLPLRIGDFVQVYSQSVSKWVNAEVIDVNAVAAAPGDIEHEWVKVRYCSSGATKHVRADNTERIRRLPQ